VPMMWAPVYAGPVVQMSDRADGAAGAVDENGLAQPAG